jgi:hypothetical protein
MALPRPVLIAVLGLALCAAAFLATRSAKDPGGSITAAPTPAPAVTHPASGNGAAKKAKAHKAAPAAKKHDATEQQAERTLNEASRAATEQETGRKAPADDKPAQAGKPEAKPSGTHQTAVEVKGALDRGDVVVFFFTHHGAADDQQTRQAVATLRGQKHVKVVQAGLKQLADYRPVLAGAGVSQVPSIVIVRGDQPARLLEGYVDRGTLRQNVADALR